MKNLPKRKIFFLKKGTKIAPPPPPPGVDIVPFFFTFCLYGDFPNAWNSEGNLPSPIFQHNPECKDHDGFTGLLISPGCKLIPDLGLFHFPRNPSCNVQQPYSTQVGEWIQI